MAKKKASRKRNPQFRSAVKKAAKELLDGCCWRAELPATFEESIAQVRADLKEAAESDGVIDEFRIISQVLNALAQQARKADERLRRDAICVLQAKTKTESFGYLIDLYSSAFWDGIAFQLLHAYFVHYESFYGAASSMRSRKQAVTAKQSNSSRNNRAIQNELKRRLALPGKRSKTAALNDMAAIWMGVTSPFDGCLPRRRPLKAVQFLRGCTGTRRNGCQSRP